jgi:diguanylate cyclase (GGDEF)-like protein
LRLLLKLPPEFVEIGTMRGLSSKLGLLTRFSVMSLIPIVLLGLVLAHTLKDQARERNLESAREAAQYFAQFGVKPQLSPSDLRAGLKAAQLRKLHRVVAASRRGTRVVRMKLWNRNGRVMYSDDRHLIGRRFGKSDELATALKGRVASELSHADRDENAEEHGYGQLLEVYVPLRFGRGARPAGAFEMYVPYAPIAAAISHDTRRLYGILFGGLALLYLALFRIVARASRTLRRQAAENRHQALHDGLTGLANRALFHDRVEQATRQARRDRSSAAVLLIDLDRFKEVNDTLGHHKGDVLLKDVGLRLREALRESDTIARLGGDEFGVVLPGLGTPAAAMQAAERIQATVDQDFLVDDLAVHLDASIGIALFPQHGEDVDMLIQRADVAMYEAKRSHGGYEIYASETDPYNPVQLAMVGELRRALQGDELVLHYQPKVELHSSNVRGVEALVRWRHPERGLLPPAEFVPMAERTGLIRPLTRYVLNVALAQCREWYDAGQELQVSVNLSARNLLDPSLPEDISRLLGKWRVKPELLELEITESTIMTDPTRSTEVLTRLDGMGIALSIDDFGTGYSSLSYLRELPVAELKIDRAFVKEMATDEDNRFIVRSTISLGQNLGLQVVAEGVEDEQTLEQLRELGCDFAQGYFLSRPVAAGELSRWLHARSAEAVRVA